MWLAWSLNWWRTLPRWLLSWCRSSLWSLFRLLILVLLVCKIYQMLANFLTLCLLCRKVSISWSLSVNLWSSWSVFRVFRMFHSPSLRILLVYVDIVYNACDVSTTLSRRGSLVFNLFGIDPWVQHWFWNFNRIHLLVACFIRLNLLRCLGAF